MLYTQLSVNTVKNNVEVMLYVDAALLVNSGDKVMLYMQLFK